MSADQESEFDKWLGAKAAAAEQLKAEMSTLAQSLGTFRSQLILNGFTTDGAEDHTLELFIRWLDTPAPDDDDTGDDE